jgi:hypothetical protein
MSSVIAYHTNAFGITNQTHSRIAVRIQAAPSRPTHEAPKLSDEALSGQSCTAGWSRSPRLAILAEQHCRGKDDLFQGHKTIEFDLMSQAFMGFVWSLTKEYLRQ